MKACDHFVFYVLDFFLVFNEDVLNFKGELTRVCKVPWNLTYMKKNHKESKCCNKISVEISKKKLLALKVRWGN